MLGSEAVAKIIQLPCKSVLDIGCGAGEQAVRLADSGKNVTAIDMETSHHVGEIEQKSSGSAIDYICDDFLEHDFANEYDCVFACHVLEHQRNVGEFLRKMVSVTADDGFMCITVPPAKSQIVGGHLSIWNAGLLLYNLVIAGIDCSQARVRRYGYNISVIAQKRTIELPCTLKNDSGDIEKLANYLPVQCRKQSFNGNIKNLNWEP